MVLKALVPGRETSRVDDGANVGFALGGPHGAIAVGDLALNDGGSEGAFAGVVGRVDQSGPVGEGQKLIAGAPELVLKVAGQIAGRRRGQDIVQTSLQGPALAGDGRGGEGFDTVGQGEGPVQPELEPRGQDILARLVGIGDVAGEMGQAGLVRVGMPLLRGYSDRNTRPRADARPSGSGPRWRPGSARRDGQPPRGSETPSDRRCCPRSGRRSHRRR